MINFGGTSLKDIIFDMKNFLLLFVAFFFISLSVTVPGDAIARDSNNAAERWTAFGGDTLPKMVKRYYHSRLFFIYEPSSSTDSIIKVSVNGTYLTSLLNGGYRSVVVCSGKNKISYSLVRSGHFNEIRSVSYQFFPSQTVFLKFTLSDDNKLSLKRISDGEARYLIKGVKQQTQTLPRIKYNPMCEETK
ncbi:MAG: hypothetical protein CSA47_01980 [Gammaproteobacteria bacterium]|nr:MAG: hypothetical protein CSA47_01980 [Gammaproteobacteria bacterium]